MTKNREGYYHLNAVCQCGTPIGKGRVDSLCDKCRKEKSKTSWQQEQERLRNAKPWTDQQIHEYLVNNPIPKSQKQIEFELLKQG